MDPIDTYPEKDARIDELNEEGRSVDEPQVSRMARIRASLSRNTYVSILNLRGTLGLTYIYSPQGTRVPSSSTSLPSRFPPSTTLL